MNASFLFLLGMAAALIVGSGFVNTAKIKKIVSKKTHVRHLSKAVGLLIVMAQINELVKVVEHTNVVTVTAALLLLAIVVAAKAGTEGEMF